jgi:hypothetical protein
MSTRTDAPIRYLNRDWTPLKAMKTDYLLYSILSMSAAHMNVVNPDIRTKTLSLQLRHKAISTYAKALNSITKDNYETILITSVYMMGMVPRPEPPSTDEKCVEWAVALFQMSM